MDARPIDAGLSGMKEWINPSLTALRFEERVRGGEVEVWEKARVHVVYRHYVPFDISLGGQSAWFLFSRLARNRV